MHHVVLEQWSRGESGLHRRDPRAKAGVLGAFLILLATTSQGFAAVSAAYLLLLLAAIAWARLPLGGAILRAGVVLPFSLVFGLASWAAGDPNRAAHLVAKSYLSALAVLLVAGTTPLPHLLRGLELLGAPRFLLMVTQFLYRYLFVISEEAQHMRAAAAARAGGFRRRSAMRAAAGALAVLFARSYARAEGIHRAMLARGFQGRFRLLSPLGFGWRDAAFLLGGAAVLIMLRFALEARWA